MEELIHQFWSLHTVVAVACAAFFVKAARIENAPPLLWGGLSLLVSLLTGSVLGWGLVGCLVGQLALLAGIAVFRALREHLTPP